MKKSARIFFATSIFFSCMSASSNAAEISFFSHGKGLGIEIIGELRTGDSEKFLTLILENPIALLGSQQVRLNSRGGSVDEALKIADLIEKTGLITTVDENGICASACFLIYVAGSTRAPLGPILIHRPYFDTTKVDHTRLYEYSKAQQQSTLKLRTFLESHSVPGDIIDKMMSLPSNAAYELSSEDEDRIGFLSPTFEEVAINNCGTSNANFIEGDPAALATCMYPSTMRMRAVFLRDRLAREDAVAAAAGFRISMQRGYFDVPDAR